MMRDSIIKIVRRNTEKGKSIFRFYLFFIAGIITLLSIWGLIDLNNKPAIDRIVINQFEERNIDEYLSDISGVCGIDISNYKIDFEKIYRSEDKFLYRYPDGYVARLTLNSNIQNILMKNLKIYNIPFVAAVVMEASSGRILGLYERRQEGTTYSIFKAYKAASVFKIITMEALLSENDIDIDKTMCYHGGKRRLVRSHLIENPTKDYRCMQIDKALGYSANVIFARLAYRYLDKDTLKRHTLNFGFGEDIPLELNIERSHVDIPVEREELAYTAAGFGNTYISPIHGAIIASIIANTGVYVKPTIVDEIVDDKNNVLYSHLRTDLKTVCSPDVAAKLRDMMRVTILEGTAHKFFAKRGRVDFIREVPVAGKTGSIADKKGDYTEYNWFVGFAPSDSPKYVISVLTVNAENVSARATVYARNILNDLFLEKKRVASSQSLRNKILGGK